MVYKLCVHVRVCAVCFDGLTLHVWADTGYSETKGHTWVQRPPSQDEHGPQRMRYKTKRIRLFILVPGFENDSDRFAATCLESCHFEGSKGNTHARVK